MSFFDNPEVHKTILMTVQCGQNYIRTKPGGVMNPTLTHMREMTRDLTTVSGVFSVGY